MLNLHNDKRMFTKIICESAMYYSKTEREIEKDYWIFWIQQEISKYPNVIFKGSSIFGSLFISSINRLPNDIDLDVIIEKEYQKNEMDMFCKHIMNCCKYIDFVEEKYYGNFQVFRFTKEEVKFDIDVSYIEMTSLPLTKRINGALIYKYLTDYSEVSFVDKYKLKPNIVKSYSNKVYIIRKVLVLHSIFLEDKIDFGSSKAFLKNAYDLYVNVSQLHVSDNLFDKECILNILKENERFGESFGRRVYHGEIMNSNFASIMLDKELWEKHFNINNLYLFIVKLKELLTIVADCYKIIY